MPLLSPRVRMNYTHWWQHQGPCIYLAVRKPAVPPPPPRPADQPTFWFDPAYRAARALHGLNAYEYFCEAFPFLDTNTGPGNLNLYLGSEPGLSYETVWYRPSIADPETHGPLRFSPENKWFRAHMALTECCLRAAGGLYAVGFPDLVENIDILAGLRDTQVLLEDFVERPAWIRRSLEEINQAYFQVFDLYYQKLAVDGGNIFSAFALWGPGKTAKVQADLACMISREMFQELIVPPLQRQCQWLDYSMFHLDGEDALHHLDALLAIDELDAIEWTPVGTSDQVVGKPSGGDPCFYDLYRRIKQAGKSVQAINIKPHEVRPLLDAVGPEGMMLTVGGADLDTAAELAETLEGYYPQA